MGNIGGVVVVNPNRKKRTEPPYRSGDEVKERRQIETEANRVRAVVLELLEGGCTGNVVISLNLKNGILAEQIKIAFPEQYVNVR